MMMICLLCLMLHRGGFEQDGVAISDVEGIILESSQVTEE